MQNNQPGKSLPGFFMPFQYGSVHWNTFVQRMTMNDRTAIVIGATGLVGRELVRLLLDDDRFSKITVLARRSPDINHPKLAVHIIDFRNPPSWKHLVTGTVLFSTLGTTLKTAGSKKAQYEVDYGYQFAVAKAAAENGVPVYVLVSSAMANPGSSLFYTRMKGELERDIKTLPFHYIRILQPGMLQGNRTESRPGEKSGIAVLRFLNRLGILKSQQPVPVATVAQTMINLSFASGAPVETHTLQAVFEAAK
jgi:uncharacterized protein YbjT (DUF2867 family)